MSEIGLLMTGMLTTGQASVPNLPKQQQLHLANGVQESIQSHLPQVVSTAQITPPEFMQADGTSPDTASSVLKKDKLLKQIHKKLSSPSSSSLDQNNHSQFLMADGVRVATRSQKFNSQPMPLLRFGSSGIAVRVLQRLLVSNGYRMRVDGVFGPLTETAVKAFQYRQSLAVDGIVGQKTWYQLSI
ncbi:MAG: peptidoglycan-binding protein [Mojavia pulchra JT2-VF2]|jgi:murein L,D-transpeptidase YcbB/YkuD|uniref:Peptidoglycan-binding protein n=1 Tax=Mojavia pulchra JT2-VF2 TaxID=287848 RepID=A0A951PX53_9NOST|nr:peptidoglycan-binding protein [Mojavia pulchra JT2-VF2]